MALRCMLQLYAVFFNTITITILWKRHFQILWRFQIFWWCFSSMVWIKTSDEIFLPEILWTDWDGEVPVSWKYHNLICHWTDSIIESMVLGQMGSKWRSQHLLKAGGTVLTWWPRHFPSRNIARWWKIDLWIFISWPVKDIQGYSQEMKNFQESKTCISRKFWLLAPHGSGWYSKPKMISSIRIIFRKVIVFTFLVELPDVGPPEWELSNDFDNALTNLKENWSFIFKYWFICIFKPSALNW